MPEAVKRGTSDPLQQEFIEHYDPENGFTRNFEWKGAEESRVRAYAALYAAQGCAYHLVIRNDVATLSVNDTTGNQTIDRWEVDGQRLQKSSLLNPRNVQALLDEGAANEAFATAILTDIGTVLNSSGDLATQSLEPGGLDANGFYTELGTNSYFSGQRLMDRIRQGSTDFQFDGYIIRHTTNVSNRYQANIADININLTYSRAQLLTELLDPTLWVFPIPDRLVYKIQAIAHPTHRDFYKWGWIKSVSTEHSAANNRVDISTLYELDQWSTDEYGIAGADDEFA